MRKVKTADLFGHNYRMTQLSAASAFEQMYLASGGDDLLPLVSTVEFINAENGAAIRLDNAAAINANVKDRIDVMKPRLVLSALYQAVHEFNFGFLENRKAVKVPRHLTSDLDVEVRSVEGESPILATLIAEGKATLRELQEFYSLEDAFLIYDVLFIEKLNNAEIQHAAMKSAKKG